MRVLMVIPDLTLGGAAADFLRLARYLADHLPVTVAVMADNPAMRPEGCGYRVLGEGMAAGPGVLAKARRWAAMRARLRELKGEHQVAISFLTGANLLNALAGYPERTVLSERGSKRHEAGLGAVDRFLMTRVYDPYAYRRAARVVAASRGVALEIGRAHPWLGERLLAIEGSVDADSLLAARDAPVEAEFEELREGETIVTYGRLHPAKGFDFLLQVVAALRASRPRVRLLLIGEGEERAALTARARRLGLSVGEPGSDAVVVLAGHRPMPHRYARLGRVLAFPSRQEGLPNAVIEAVASGVPVVAADCPWGPRTVLSEGTLDELAALELPKALPHGILMPRIDAPHALERWCATLGDLLSHPPARRSAAECHPAIARYDIRHTGPQWLALIEEVARQARGRHGR
ncbi:MAG: hypothetical protein KatS3mg124_0786 [Porticoccaceae bacterium]|nr:MAG: hypothetical protein KatS3mg124_0786 [Porticoccaceae bacterium]